MSVCMKLKISVTTEPIGSCDGFKLFSWGVGYPQPPQNYKNPPIIFNILLGSYFKINGSIIELPKFFNITSWGKAPRGEAAST